MITPLDIDKKEFTRGRGYKDDEVDAFLEEVSETIRSLIFENEDLKQEIINWQKKYDEALTKFGDMENSLYTTLESAKGLMNEISASAEKRAEILVSNAQLEADSILTKARTESENLLSESEARLKTIRSEEAYLKEKVGNFKSLFQSILESELKTVGNLDVEIFGEKLNDDFDNFIAAVKK